MSDENTLLREYEVHVIRELMVRHHLHASSCDEAAATALSADPRSGELYMDLTVSVYECGASKGVTYNVYPDGHFEEQRAASVTAKG